ncbi:MAG: hypothetical protein KAW46_07800 [candidate division Zixibacteria bacterium]|nr:hypothetical protein [candidate division Zixibacteria bacterium]
MSMDSIGRHKIWTTAPTALIVVCCLLLCLPGPVGAQVDTVANLPGITVKTSVDRAEMFIGDLITYKLTITYDSTYELVPPPLGANLGAFDVKDYQTDIITRLDDGRIRSENIFTLSTFTTGDYVIPPISVLFNLPDGGRKMVLSEAVPITVNSLLGNESDSADIRPLKPPKPPEVFARDPREKFIYGGVALLFILITALLLWRRFRRRKSSSDLVDRRTRWEIAFERLALLKEQNLVAQELYKQHYIELTEIAREYLGRMYAVDVLEMTTDEFLQAFHEIPLPGELYGTMHRFFDHADLVKFAKYIPDSARAEADFDVVHDLVETVRADHERRRRTEIAITSDSNKKQDTMTEVAG